MVKSRTHSQTCEKWKRRKKYGLHV